LNPSPLLSSNIQYIFAFIIVILAGIVAFLFKRVDSLHTRIETLQESRRVDAVEVGTKALETMQSFSQTVQLIESKLLVSKRGR
jgi:hypothetical protein